MSAWAEIDQEENKDIEKGFEDNFVSSDSKNQLNKFERLEDSDKYLQALGKFLNFKFIQHTFSTLIDLLFVQNLV
jgi:hypothetical protein